MSLAWISSQVLGCWAAYSSGGLRLERWAGSLGTSISYGVRGSVASGYYMAPHVAGARLLHQPAVHLTSVSPLLASVTRCLSGRTSEGPPDSQPSVLSRGSLQKGLPVRGRERFVFLISSLCLLGVWEMEKNGRAGPAAVSTSSPVRLEALVPPSATAREARRCCGQRCALLRALLPLWP